jgi:tetratricopeptide (TPR) repeat protein
MNTSSKVPQQTPPRSQSDFSNELLHYLGQGQHFSVVFLYVSHSGIAKGLLTHVASRLVAAQRAIQVVNFSPAVVAQRGIDMVLREVESKTPANSVYWLDLSSGATAEGDIAAWDQLRERVLLRLNVLRSRFERERLAPMVIVLPTFRDGDAELSWAREAANLAPDLWTIRQLSAHVPDGFLEAISTEEISREQHRIAEAVPVVNIDTLPEHERWKNIVANGQVPTGSETRAAFQALMDSARFQEGLDLATQALKIYESQTATESLASEIGATLNDAGRAALALAKFDKADVFFKRALKIDEASYGPDHPTVAVRLNNLARLLELTNRLSDAEPLYRRALKIQEASFGLEHPNVATTLNNLAGLLESTNRLSEAEPLYRRALLIVVAFTAATGHQHPNLRVHIGNYQQCLIELKRDEASIRAEMLAVLAPLLKIDLDDAELRATLDSFTR